MHHELNHLVEINDSTDLQTLLELSRTKRIIKARTRRQIDDFINLRTSIISGGDSFDRKILNTTISLLAVIVIDK